MKRLLARLLSVAAAAALIPACGGGGSDTPPPTLNLLLPAAGATGVSIQPTYSWSAIPNAIDYLLQVSTVPTFATVLIHRPGLATTSDTPSTVLGAGTAYYWRVYANTLTGAILAVGSPALFTTEFAPGAFSLQSPANGAINQSASPLMTWTSSSSAATYTLQVATDSGFSALVIDQPGIVTLSFIPASPLSDSTTYYWRVSAVNTAGTTAATSSPRSFTTAPPAPGSFSLTAPATSATDVALSPTFTWTASSNAATYTLQVSTSSSFSSFAVDKPGITGTSDSPAVVLSTSTVYYWRVTAVNVTASTPDSGGTASFTTAPPGTISISTTSMSFTATAGGANPTGQNLQITNPIGAGSPLRWSVSSDRPWLQFTVLSGTTGSETDIVGITPVIAQTEAWTTATTLSGAPGGRENFSLIWTGEQMIVWGGSVGATTSNDGACYDPAIDAWVKTTTLTGAAPARIAHTAVWTGSKMIIWGGRNGGTYYGDGYLYDPRKDSWSGPISAVNAPTARTLHSAVWTGTEMLVWGGYDGSIQANGASYNPVTDVWTPLPTSGAPGLTEDHFAVWTGTDMLIWGGEDSGFTRLDVGKKYNRSSNAWGAAITTTGAPAARAGGASGWTGSEMFIWGGISNSALITNDGGRYDPLSDSWQPVTLTNALSARRSDQAVWAGSEMIVWGGYSEPEGYMNSGKRYHPPISLAAGVYTGTITITDPDASNSPRTVNVTLTVTP